MAMFTNSTKEEMLNEVKLAAGKLNRKVVSTGDLDKATKQDLYIVTHNDGSEVYGATPSTIENLHFNYVVLNSY